MKTKDRLLNWQQACELLGCGKTFFYDLVSSGQLSAIRLGKVKGLRIKESECQKYLNLKRKNNIKGG